MIHKKTLLLGSLSLLLLVCSLSPRASAAWKEKVLYSFQYVPDGATPVGAIVFDSSGNLYGATTQGGSTACRPFSQCGTVFQLAPPVKQGDPWTETVLYVFQGNGVSDGALPAGGLIIDSAGNLYGTTAYGGTGNCVLLGILAGCGTVFEMSPPKQKGGAWTETVLYSFPTAKQGYLPNGDLVFDSAGNLYGATKFGGGHGTTCNVSYLYCGAVFELIPPKTKGGKWTQKVLHGFKGVAQGAGTEPVPMAEWFSTVRVRCTGHHLEAATRADCAERGAAEQLSSLTLRLKRPAGGRKRCSIASGGVLRMAAILWQDCDSTKWAISMAQLLPAFWAALCSPLHHLQTGLTNGNTRCCTISTRTMVRSTQRVP